jgi:hypothetical protein
MRHSPKKSKLILGLTLGWSFVAVGFGTSAVGASKAAPTTPSDGCKVFKVNSIHTKFILGGCQSLPPPDRPPVKEAGAGSFPVGASNFNIIWNPPYEGGTAANPKMTGIMYFAGGPGDGDCPPGRTDHVFTGTIGPTDTTDPGNGDVGASVHADICVNSAGAYTPESGTAFTFGEPPGGG